MGSCMGGAGNNSTMARGRIGRWIETRLLSMRFNIFAYSLNSWHVWGCISPINQELLELDKQKYQKRNLDFTFEHWLRDNRSETQPSDDWFAFFLKPIQLARCIKRYHSAGNWFLVYMSALNVLCFYIWAKAVFHHFKTGNDEKLAEYYATHYFPRLFESYPEPHGLYPYTMTVTSYYLLERIVTSIYFIKRSIVNRNGYRKIDSMQLSSMFVSVLNWDFKEWCRFMRAASTHRAPISKDAPDDHEAAAKCAHLHFPQDLLGHHQIMTNHDMKYDMNPIDFSKCYEFHGLDLTRKNPKTFYIYEPCCRIDLPELRNMVALFAAGVPLLVTLPRTIGTMALIYELVVLLPDTEAITFWNCLSQLPVFLTDFGRVIRFLDICIFICAQFPLQNQSAAVGLDISGLISRARKVNDSLRENLAYCNRLAREYELTVMDELADGETLVVASTPKRIIPPHVHRLPSDIIDDILVNYHRRTDNDHRFTNITKAERNLLCRKLNLNLRLARIVKQELADAKEAYSAYINILIAASGVYMAVVFASSFILHNALIRILLYASLLAGTVPLSILVPLCIWTEHVFTGLYMTLLKLMLNKGSYIEEQLIRKLVAEVGTFEKATDRAFTFIGQYSITYSTLGPYIAYLSTCIIIVSKLLFG